MMSDSKFDFYDDGEKDNSEIKNDSDDGEKATNGVKDDSDDGEDVSRETTMSKDEAENNYEDSFSESSDKEDRKTSESSRQQYDYSDDENKNGGFTDDDDDKHSRRSVSPPNGNITPRSDHGSSRHSRHTNSERGSRESSSKNYSRYSSVDSNSRSRESSRENIKAKQQKKKPPVQNGVARKNAHNKTSGRGRGRGVGRRSVPVSGRTEKSAVVDRVLSANRHKSRALHNVIHELQQQVDKLTIENRDLQRVARLQDKEIRKLNDDEAQLPALLHKHNSDIRVKEGKIKKQKEELDKLRETVKRRETELRKNQDKLTKYEDLVKQKNLLEASELSKKVESLQNQLQDKDKKIAELSKNSQAKDKNTLRDLRVAREKLKNTTEQSKILEKENELLKQKLQEKEKILVATNIYTNKSSKDPSRPLFTPSSPMPYVLRKHTEGMDDESQYSESDSQSLPASEVSSMKSKHAVNAKQGPTKADKKPQTKKAFATPVESPRSKPVKTMVGQNQQQMINGSDDDDDFYAGKQSAEDERLKEIERKLEEINKREEELMRKEEEEREQKRQEEEMRRKRQLEKEEEQQRQEEIEKKRREEEIAKQHEEENKRRQEEEEVNKRRQEEENSRKAQQDMERQAVEESLKKEEEEKRKKRELLIARMKAIDQGEDPDKVEIPEPSGKPNSSTAKKKKPIFLEGGNSTQSNNNKENEILPSEPLDFSSKPSYSRRSTDDSIKAKPQELSRRNTNERMNSSERRNSWEFKPTDENLHKGLPSHSGLKNDTPRFSRKNTQDSLGSGKSSGRNGRNRRAQLLDEDLDMTYSPSSLNNSPAPSSNAAPSKKSGKSPFDQFEDPFSLSKPKKKKQSNQLVFSSDEDDELDAPSYQPSKARAPPVKTGPVVSSNRSNQLQLSDEEGDLEEMTIG